MKPNNEITKDTVAAPETRKFMQREKDTFEKKHLCVRRWKDRKEHFFVQNYFFVPKKAPLQNKVDSRSQGASEPGISMEKSISQSTCFF